MADSPGKSDHAFRTISELAADLGVPQHILRYWETRFPQLRPLQRAGNRRYYRPADVALAHRIHRLLNQNGYTVRGVQQLLSSGSGEQEPEVPAPPTPLAKEQGELPAAQLRSLRNMLAEALDSTAAQ